jgi:hypothetical protein
VEASHHGSPFLGRIFRLLTCYSAASAVSFCLGVLFFFALSSGLFEESARYHQNKRSALGMK